MSSKPRDRHQPQAVRRDQPGGHRLHGGGSAFYRNRPVHPAVQRQIDRWNARRRGFQRHAHPHEPLCGKTPVSWPPPTGMERPLIPKGWDHEELRRLIAAETVYRQLRSRQAFRRKRLCRRRGQTGKRAHPQRAAQHGQGRCLHLPPGDGPTRSTWTNWRNYLDADGVPSSRIIVEGGQHLHFQACPRGIGTGRGAGHPGVQCQQDRGHLLLVRDSGRSDTVCGRIQGHPSQVCFRGARHSGGEGRRRGPSSVPGVQTGRGEKRLLTSISHEISKAINSLADGSGRLSRTPG